MTSSLASFDGGFFVDSNVVAAVSVFVAAPPIIAYIFLQRHFIAGLALGATSD